MKKLALLGRKVGMTQIFDDNGFLVPVTVIDTTGCVVTQIKTKEKDGYSAVQLGIGEKKPQNVNKAKAGHFKKANTAAKAELHEVRLAEGDDAAGVQLGATLACTMFQKGDRVDVKGISKGKGFQGPMKRHNFAGKDAGHGTSKYFRHVGSIGMHTYPGRVFPGKKMPGHMGTENVTVQNILVLDVKADENLILLRGGIPGGKRGVIYVQAAVKRPVPADRALTK
jgi:large subunit ribosomal protein L3